MIARWCRGASVLGLLAFTLMLSVWPVHARGAEQGGDKPTSFARDVMPILNRSCVACHEPAKKKGKLDLTTFGGFRTGGKTGPAFVAGEPGKSLVIEQVSGDEPEMPAKGERLTKEEVATLSRWIQEGAKDDTPAIASASPGGVEAGPAGPTEAPVYRLPPVIGAMACAPDGKLLAIAGRNEVLLCDASGGSLVKRLPSGSPRTTSLIFSPDGKWLAAAGGSPGVFGQILLWDTADWKLSKNYKASRDTLFGLSFSPTGDRIAVGCADRTVRVLSAVDGKELAKLEPHSDWVLGTAFTLSGTQIVSGGRDKSVKLTDIAMQQRVDEINEPVEAIASLARHPSQDLIVCGGAAGNVSVYRISDLKKKTDEQKDPNRIREMEHQPGPANAIAFSPDGQYVAIASLNEARIYASKEGNRTATLSGSRGGVFALAFSPDGKRVYTAGYDGKVRVFDAEHHGQLLKAFVPVPLAPGAEGVALP